MSSREISALTGKKHFHVVRDIEKMLQDIGCDASKFGCVYLDAKGEQRKCYNLPKNLTLNLITGYRSDLRLKVIDRWLELEASTSPVPDPRVPRTLSEALRLAADQQDRIAAQADTIAQQQVRIERDAPKVSALARIAGTEGSIDMRQAAKNLQVNPILLRNFMRDQRWIYRKGEHWLAYQTKLDSGLLEHKLVTLHQESGRTKIVTRLRVTAKGISRLGEMLHGWGAAR
ncbi:phage regulatory protein/antirepressor Ant [Gluconacetobacter entanii]|uniref:Phage regulatory protein/antirepressor Ant n=1 Tax=Gluconacetobacter entanii TaxID=108528 RepID=A0ABT3K2I8_9PROT|nr:phage regulatory protein/antirepressor Ant [Gluconacetobacter entanii]MCW4589620.1 phage regulatory protein/antirepressor Ant [Gluconacetobacter entanii]MCW4592928.1 phage regulatory protein/antirepressor Ant [Gluconacetobacter entanii]NPC89174.1 DNA-binding protein [Gluconacetobacter entanii]